ncbi:hypothetical protein [Halosimplex marinum]|uniref:hypothetical protein n=1 Tax=Halosimplex marinum TaxID=3396620 RepID=UPI003F556036
MTAFGLPIGPDSERAWFVGLAAILVVSALVGLVVFPNVQLQPDDPGASIRFSGAEGVTPVEVTVQRVEPGPTETVVETTVDAGESTVHTTGESGLYYVRLDTRGGSCHRRVEIEQLGRTGFDIEWIGDPAPECPATLSVET